MPAPEVVGEVDLGPDRPGVAGVGVRDGLADRRGGADHVGRLDDLAAALGVDDHADVVVLPADRLDVRLAEALVDLTVAVPEDHVVLDDVARVRRLRVPRVPLGDLVFEPQAVGRVLSEVLVGEEQHLVAPVERVLERVVGVRGRTDQPALLGAERLEVGVAVHVGDRDHVRVGLGSQFRPRRVDLEGLGHPGHRTGRLHAREDHLLSGVGDDVRGLGHERDAAEDDVLGVGGGGLLAQLVGVADEVRVFDDLPPLVVVAQDHHVVAERPQRLLDALRSLRFGERSVFRWKLFEVVVFEETEISLELRSFHCWHRRLPS
ncbi:hypothetical protein BN903_56 [Halorubrum sp. AJ67]|nr:hypothetical protein BN903_56 [Halorubrum sp. AJ67]